MKDPLISAEIARKLRIDMLEGKREL